MKIVFVVCVGLAAVAYVLSRIEFERSKDNSPITKKHKETFKGML